jgi:hypothetical protein
MKDGRLHISSPSRWVTAIQLLTPTQNIMPGEFEVRVVRYPSGHDLRVAITGMEISRTAQPEKSALGGKHLYRIGRQALIGYRQPSRRPLSPQIRTYRGSRRVHQEAQAHE